MAGIAIIVKDMSFADSNLGQVTFAGQTIPITGIAITNSGTTVPINASTLALTVAYTPANTTQKAVVWSITSGGTYATINQSGVVTLHNLVANAQFTVKVQSAVDATVNATKTFTVVSGNMITSLKNGQKANASTGAFESNSDYISTDWIDVDNVAFATLTLASSVAGESQVDGSVSASNCKIGIVYQDNSGNYHDIALANNFIASTYTAETLSLKLPVREMKKISLYSLTSEASSSDPILKCNSSDWNAATLVVDTLKVSGTETYGSEIWNYHAISRSYGANSTVNSALARYQAGDMVEFMTMIKSGESVSLHTRGGSTGKAWFKYALDGTMIAMSDAAMDYNTNAYTFTADQDMFLTGTAYTAEAEQFELKITKS